MGVSFLEEENYAMTSVPETEPQRAVLRYSNMAVALHWIVGR